MPRPAILACLFAAGFALQASTAAAQAPARNPNLPDFCTSKEVDARDDFSRFTGDVVCKLPDGTLVYGDIVNLYEEGDAHRIVAEGHVVFDGAAGYISASRMQYNTKTGTGTLVLSGANTYSNGTTISAGTMRFAATSAMPSSGMVTPSSGGTLAVNAGGGSEWVDSRWPGTG